MISGHFSWCHCLPACWWSSWSENNKLSWIQEVNEAETVRIVISTKKSQLQWLLCLLNRLETLGLMLIHILINIRKITATGILHQLIQLCCYGSTVKLAQAMKHENLMNRRLNYEGSTALGALGASSVSLQLKHCAVERLRSWLVISKCGHGVPSPAVISEALPSSSPTHDRMHGNLLKRAMEGLLYVNGAFCLKGHI